MNTSNTNWNLYRSFIIAYETRNLTVACEMLGITRSAVGHNIHELGRQLGVKLFSPTPSKRGVEPTGEAMSLYPLVKECFDKLEIAETSIKGFNENTPAIIRLAVATSLASHQLAPYISRFCKRYPKVKLEFLRKEAVELLSKKKIDIAISPKRHFANRNFMFIDLFNDRLNFIASKDFLKNFHVKPIFKLEDIKDLPIIDRYEENSNNKIFGLNITPSYFAATTEQIYSMVKDGIGIGFYWDKALTEKQLQEDGIVKLSASDIFIDEVVSCAYNKTSLTKVAKVFLDGLVEFCKNL